MSLQFNVSLLSQEEIGSVREYTVETRLLVGDEPTHGDLTGDISMLRIYEGILVTAKLAGEQPDTCSRCLAQVTIPLALNIQEEFFLSVDPQTSASLAPPDDPDAFRIGENQVLDLEEAVRQAWTSALPIQPLCRVKCAGLCSQCGQDLNQSACSCDPAPDERWSALKELAAELKGN